MLAANTQHIITPIYIYVNMEINTSPVALNESEISFVKALQKYVSESTEYFDVERINMILRQH